MGATFDSLSYSVLDPVATTDAVVRLGVEPPAALALCNSFRTRRGSEPADGWVLIPRSVVTELQAQPTGLHSLFMLDDLGNQVTLEGLVIVRAVDVIPGWPNDPKSAMLVQISDQRWLCKNPHFTIPSQQQFNVRQYGENETYYAHTLNSGVPWTYEEVLEQLWIACQFLGIWPGLPEGVEIDSTPENILAEAVPAIDKLQELLQLNGLTIRHDPLVSPSFQYSVVKIGDRDADFEAALIAADPRKIHDSQPIQFNGAIVPETVRVFFRCARRVYLKFQTPQDPVYVDVPSDDADAFAGTIHYLDGDLIAREDYDGSTIANQAELDARAAELAQDYLDTIKGTYAAPQSLGYAGLLATTNGSACREIRWRSQNHNQGAWVTDVWTKPDPSEMPVTCCEIPHWMRAVAVCRIASGTEPDELSHYPAKLWYYAGAGNPEDWVEYQEDVMAIEINAMPFRFDIRHLCHYLHDDPNGIPVYGFEDNCFSAQVCCDEVYVSIAACSCWDTEGSVVVYNPIPTVLLEPATTGTWVIRSSAASVPAPEVALTPATTGAWAIRSGATAEAPGVALTPATTGAWVIRSGASSEPSPGVALTPATTGAWAIRSGATAEAPARYYPWGNAWGSSDMTQYSLAKSTSTAGLTTTIDAWTFVCWGAVDYASSNPLPIACLFKYDRGDEGNYVLFGWRGLENALQAHVQSGSGPYAFLVAPTIWDDSYDRPWRLCALTCNGTDTTTLYFIKDGVTYTTSTPTVFPLTQDAGFSLRVGGGTEAYALYTWQGWYNDFRMYDRALSQADLEAIYAAGVDGYHAVSGSGPVRWYKCNENSGLILHDSSGNVADATPPGTGGYTNIDWRPWPNSGG